MKRFCYVIIMLSVLFTACKEKKDMQKLIWTNANGDSVDLTSGNFGITEWSGFSGTELNIQSQQVPFHDGSVYLDGLLSERELSVTLAMDAKNDLEKRYRLRRELIEILNPKLGEGYLIYRNDYTAKRIKCVPQIPLFDNCNSNDSGTPKASLAWTACDPYWEDLEETIIDLSNGVRTAVLNNGDVPIKIKLDVFSSYCGNPEVINFTNNKKIKLNEYLRSSFSINTDFGKKDVLKENINIVTKKIGLHIYSIAYSETLNKYVAVGETGLILVSSDGVNWDYRGNQVHAETLYEVCYIDGFGFIAVGSFCCIATSPTGENWTYTNLQNRQGDFLSITYRKGDVYNTYIAVGLNADSSSLVYRSVDGINWIKITVPTGDGLYSVAYSESLNVFVAVGQSGTIMTSADDGTSWISRTSGVETRLRYVFYSTSLGKFIISLNYNYLLTSSDAVNWESVSTNETILRMCEYRNSLFLGFNGGSNVLISSNLTDWEEVGAYEYVTSNFGDIKFFPQTGFVYIVSENGIISRSNNGTNWNILSGWGYPISRIDFKGVKKFNGKIFCYGSYSTGSMQSPLSNGLAVFSEQTGNWEGYSTGLLGVIKDMEYIESLNRYIFVGDCMEGTYNPNSLTYCDNDDFWHGQRTSITASLESIAFSKNLNLFVTVGESGTILTSSNGADWTSRTSGTTNNLKKIIWIEDLSLFVVVGDSGTILTSSDGVNWIVCETGYTNNIDSVAYSKDMSQIVAISGAYAKVILSFTGENWSVREFQGTGGNLCKNLYFVDDLGLFIYVGYNRMLISSDAINWNPHITLKSDSVYYDESKDVLYTVGANGVFLNVHFDFSESLINLLSSDSDMTFELDKGENELVLSCERGSVFGKLRFRQKYIGV